MGAGLSVLVVAGVCSGAGAAGWRFPQSKLFVRTLASARGGVANSPGALAVSLATEAASPAWLWAATAAVGTGAVAGALTTAGDNHFFEYAWLVPWAGVVALLAAVDLTERVVPTQPARAASLGTLALAVPGGAVSGDWSLLARSLGCAAVVWALLAAWSSLSPRTLGFGDVRAAFLIALGAGAVSPPAALAGLAGAHLAAGLWAKVPFRTKQTTESVPLGPFYAVAGIAVVVAGVS